MTVHPDPLGPNCRLFRTASRSGHPIHGLYFQAHGDKQEKRVVIHSHGTLGNFYYNPFIEKFAHSYNARGISFVSFNHEAHDGISESEIDGRLEYIGGSKSDFSSCLDDFYSVRDLFWRLGYESFIMQGHSLGCERVVLDRRASEKEWPLILLAPVNTYATQSAWCRSRLGLTVEALTKKLQRAPTASLRTDIYGSPSEDPEWDYYIPVYESAYLSLATSEAFTYFDPQRSSIKSIDNTLIIFAASDAFHQLHSDDMRAFFQSILGKGGMMRAYECNHDFDGVLAAVCDDCIEFINSN